MTLMRNFPKAVFFFSIVAATSASAADWDAGGGERWQKLLDGAKAEGGTVASAICAELGPSLAKAFKEDTGLELTFLPGNSQELTSRMRTEFKSGHVTIDARTSGPSDLEFVRAGYAADLSEILFLPNAIDPKNWEDGHISWADKAGKYMVLPAEYVSTRPVINKDVIDAATIKTWGDLMKPEFAGKIASYDPTVPGAGQTLGAYLAKVRGLDFVVDLFDKQKVVLSRDSKQLGEWAARGLYPVILGIDALYFDRLTRDGLTSLEWVTPEDGPGSLVGGCAMLSVPKDAPHPNAAALFANWYLTSRGQTVLEEAAHYPSRRTDIPHDQISPFFLPVPGRDYINQYKEDWYAGELVGIRAALKERLQNLVSN